MIIANRSLLLKNLLKMQTHEIILIAGKGHEEEQIYKNKIINISDKKIVKKINIKIKKNIKKKTKFFTK